MNFFHSKNFVPAPENFVLDNFQKDVLSVQQFNDQVHRFTASEAQALYQAAVMNGFTDGTVGIYSTFHDAALYHLGYDHKDTIRLAYMSVQYLGNSEC